MILLGLYSHVEKRIFDFNNEIKKTKLLYFFVFQVARMTAALLILLLAGPVMLAAGSPVHFKATNGTIPLVIWHGMGE